MALTIQPEEAVRQLENSARKARDGNYRVSELWLDRLTELEAWKGNKLAITVFGTAALAKATEPDVDPLALIDRSGDPHSYPARTFAREVMVPQAKRLGILLGTGAPDPLAGSPWFGPERIDQIDKWRPNARVHADNLIGWLAVMTSEEAEEALVAFALRRSEANQRQLDRRIEARISGTSFISMTQLSEAMDRFIQRKPEEGKRGAAAAAAAFSGAGRQVVVRPVNNPGQVDVDVLDRKGLLLLGIEVKQKLATEQDALDIAAGALGQGATQAILCAFGQRSERLSDDRLIEEADEEFGSILHVVYSTGALFRIAALTSERPRSRILQEIVRSFPEHLEALEGSHEALGQWQAIVSQWSRTPRLT
jgi:hypothetical protein